MPLHRPSGIDPLIAATLAWLLDAAAFWLKISNDPDAKQERRRLNGFVRQVTTYVNYCVLMQWAEGRSARKKERGGRRPLNAPHGFRSIDPWRRSLRRILRGAPKARGDLGARIAALRDTLRSMDAAIARFHRHVSRKPHGAGLVLRAVLIDAFQSAAPAAIRPADTS